MLREKEIVPMWDMNTFRLNGMSYDLSMEIELDKSIINDYLHQKYITDDEISYEFIPMFIELFSRSSGQSICGRIFYAVNRLDEMGEPIDSLDCYEPGDYILIG